MDRLLGKSEEEQPLARQLDELSTTDDGDDSLLDDGLVGHHRLLRRQQHHRQSRWRSSGCCFLSAAAVLITTAVLSSAAGAALAYSTLNLDRECAKHTSKYSPVLKDVDVQWGETQFNGSFMAESIYRQPASPEVDAAWEALGIDSLPGVISEEEGFKSGLTEHHVRVSDKYGGGFLVNVEGMHHLHCLNLLRKSIWYNEPYYRAQGRHAFANPDPVLRRHVSHCLDTVRQVLACSVDTGVLGQVWYDPAKPRAFPDFRTAHTCKTPPTFDAVRRWAVDAQSPAEELLPRDFLRRPRDEDVLPAEI